MKPSFTAESVTRTDGCNKCRVKSANIHINNSCNYRCGHCFTKNLTNLTQTPSDWKPKLKTLFDLGIEKINYAGGEPMLYRDIFECCDMAKDMGFTVSIVSNGSLMTENSIRRMSNSVRWIGLSIDSAFNEVEKKIGRQCPSCNHIEQVIKVSDIAHDYGIGVKLNITVLKQSFNQDFDEIIERIDPERVKAFQVTKIIGQNDSCFHEYEVSDEDFELFRKNHELISLKNRNKIVFEGGDKMIDSYLMLDPIGRIMKNSQNKQQYLPFDEIHKGIDTIVDPKRYDDREGDYAWE